ncbi:unnamed protein product, partial [Mesorhabditis belari]|uniref:Uncharacterized protein n=1 Tax=Mesorhabditis belari TaxID=2138241 RepID=A0AAF3FE28_9BILA
MSKTNEEKGDPRRTVASHILSLNIVEEKLKQTSALDAFCDGRDTLLTIARNDQKGVEMSTSSKDVSTPSQGRVVFYKNKPGPLPMDTFKQIINMVTVNGPANQVFLSSVQQVFGKNKENGSRQIEAAVSQLEDSLLATVQQNASSPRSGYGSLKDEVKAILATSDTKNEPLRDLFKPLNEAIQTAQGGQIEEIGTLVESMEDCVDGLWRGTDYGETKLARFIHSCADFLIETISERFDDSLWVDKNCVDGLNVSLQAAQQWIDTVKLNTTQVWARGVDGNWRGGEVKMPYMEGFVKRLEEILSLRSFPEQLASLLNEPHVIGEVEETISKGMIGVSPFVYSPNSETAWRAKIQATERSLEPMIERVIPILKTRLMPSNLDNNMLAMDLEKFRNFLSRTRVKERMLAERENLMSRLINVLSSKENEIDDRMNRGGQAGRYLCEVAARIVWMREQGAQLESISSSLSNLLSDLNGVQNLQMNWIDYKKATSR